MGLLGTGPGPHSCSSGLTWPPQGALSAYSLLSHKLISPSFQEFLFPLCRLRVSLPRSRFSHVSGQTPTLGSEASSKWLVLPSLGSFHLFRAFWASQSPVWTAALTRRKMEHGLGQGSGILPVTSILTPKIDPWAF